MRKAWILAVVILTGLDTRDALAHLVNASVGEFYAGMVHPLTSLEHLLPILALAAIASQKSRDNARWVVFVFPLALMGAIIAGNHYSSLDSMNVVNLVALIVLGVMVLTANRISGKILVPVAAAIGLILGYRSGMDMSYSDVGYKFVPGVGLTGFIAITVATAWFPTASSNYVRMIVRIAGTGFVLMGLYLLGKMLLLGGVPADGIAGLPSEEYIVGLVKNPELSLPVVVGAMIAVTGWGAAHAITPGHGKAIVAAFLVGSRSTPWHAVYLGLTVTLTHTLGVFILGFLTVFASRYWATQDLFPWIEMTSGLIVLTIGIGLFVSFIKARLTSGNRESGHAHRHSLQEFSSKGSPRSRSEDIPHDHHHGHSHMPTGTDGSPVTWKSLLGLGIAGGLIPCPSALVLLLAAISLQRIGFGLLLVVAFSLGLASILTVVGLLFVKGKRVLDSAPRMMALGRILPALSSLLIVIIGAGILLRALFTVY